MAWIRAMDPAGLDDILGSGESDELIGSPDAEQ
jgi:hypothetical protein